MLVVLGVVTAFSEFSVASLVFLGLGLHHLHQWLTPIVRARRGWRPVPDGDFVAGPVAVQRLGAARLEQRIAEIATGKLGLPQDLQRARLVEGRELVEHELPDHRAVQLELRVCAELADLGGVQAQPIDEDD